MNHVDFDGVAIDYTLAGTGDDVMLLHARPFVSWYDPLVAELAGYRVLQYRRSLSAHATSFGIDDDADIGRRLIRHVGFAEPHVVGHSYGGLVALALVRLGSQPVRSIALLEPASSGFLPPAQAQAGFAPLAAVARTDGPAAAMDRFLQRVCGDDYRPVLDRLVPGAFEEAVTHADQFLALELPAVVNWTYVPDDAQPVLVPVLNVVGADSAPRFVDGADVVERLLPHAVRYTLPDAGHLMMAQNPRAMAERLYQFWRQAARKRG